MEPYGNFRTLVRNLRTGQTDLLKIMQPPAEIAALAELLREEGLHAKVCPPGTRELPSRPSSIWRLKIIDGRHPYEGRIEDDKLAIRSIIEMSRFGDRRSFPDWEYAGDGQPVAPHSFELADPELPKKVARCVEGWSGPPEPHDPD